MDRENKRLTSRKDELYPHHSKKNTKWKPDSRMGSTLEEEMATHSSILAWKIPQTEEPGGLQSMGLQRVGHDLATKQQQKSDDPYLYLFTWGNKSPGHITEKKKLLKYLHVYVNPFI